MGRLRSLTTAIALGGVTASALVSSASCTSTAPSDEAPSLDSATADRAPAVDAGPIVTSDASPASTDAADARSDARPDTGPPLPTACGSLPIVVCNFNGTCADNAAIGAGGGAVFGDSRYVADAGPDGSTAFFASAPAAGAVALFGLPFQAFNPNGPTSPIIGCRVTCDANVRLAEPSDASASIIVGNQGDTFKLGITDGGWVHWAPDAAAQSAALPLSLEWVHVTIALAPTAGGASSEITLTAGDASSTTSALVPSVGQQMRFGAFSESGSVSVYFDDIVCRVFE